MQRGLRLATASAGGYCCSCLPKRLMSKALPSNSSVDQLSVPESMKAWRLHSFTGVNSAKLDTSVPVPTIQCPHDVLVKVEAASVNPLDIAMARGYGSQAFKAYNTCK